MGAYEKILTIAPALWGAMAEEMLADCFTVPGALQDVAHQVETGRATLFMVEEGGDVLAAFVLRVYDNNEGVIVAAAGGIDTFVSCLPAVEEKFIGCKAIRFHTARPGLARVWERLGYRPQEIVMRKEK